MISKIVCGVEEAGRGPVIGPMVMVGTCISSEDEKKLSGLGIKDSKLLSPRQREELFDIVLKAVKSHKIIIISPQMIDLALDDPSMNLNHLEAKTSAEIIEILKPDRAVLDCPSNNIRAYTDKVRYFMKDESNRDSIELVAEHKADLNHPIVSAASIIAKVTRDREVDKIKRELGIDFGSGYPSDPKTVKFIKDNWAKHDKIFRKTWSSYKKYLEKSGQASLGDF